MSVPALVRASSKHYVQRHPPRLAMAGRTVQRDSAGDVGIVAVEAPFHVVELKIQPDVVAHKSLESLPDAALEEIETDGCEHQVDPAVAIEIVPVHPELDAVVRPERGVDFRRELGATIAGIGVPKCTS